ncbi:amino acid adenylation domain-containing protein [Actinokineospora diospyrosa]|uniref:Amino acid adenylation domain-containing protein n=1 Tax=Actinokineospora diospyrosa TaxID=103728 RepID=A0ABT1I5V9_9PSEU|nr:amino acid adenylation domain-containing protein [Actinokineospora diospyrosa]MCP2268007.1 amino acid adenylation domain-containing protein [Actinokineospora diospyrosa]
MSALERLAALGPEQRAALERRLRARADAAPVVVAPVLAEAPLSPGQRRMWFLDQLGPLFPAYVIVSAWRVEGAVDRAALGVALGMVVDRHPALRTVYTEVDGEPRQSVRSAVVSITVVDLTGLASEERQAEVRRISDREARERFDLSAGPLLRAHLLVMGPDEHVLVLSAHHIALDGWSLSLVVSDLLTAYAAVVAEIPVDWPELTVTYADFAARQVDESPYWRAALDGMPQTLALPTDRSRPAQPTYRGGQVTFWFDDDLTARLHAVARAEKATLFTVLLAGWQALLSRYTGTTDIPVGSPVSIRPDADFDGVAGLFLNTLVLRGDLSGDPDFRTVLRRTTDTVFAGFEHRDHPFERLVDQLADSRDLASNPLFQVMLVLQNTPAPLTSAAGLRLAQLDLAPRTAKFDLNLQITEVGGRLRGELVYAAELFDADRVRRITDHYRALLAGAVADLSAPVSGLPLLTLEEEALIGAWNRTGAALPGARLPDRIAEAAARWPDRPAIKADGKWLTYREFADRVGELAARLVELGVRVDTVVGVCLPRGLDLVVALHAVQAAGGAYLPMDPEYPEARLRLLAEEAALVITAEGVGTAREPLREPVPTPDDALAYVIHTSGSTGRPKGVGVSHGAIANRISWMQEYFPIGEGDRVLQKTPAGFDVSVWEFFWPFTVGAALVVAEPGGHRDTGYLADLISREQITVLHFVPSMLDAFLDEPSLATRASSVRRVFVSGEALSTDVAARCLSALPAAELHNLYGPTETAVDVTWQAVRGLDLRHGVPIGMPVANTSIEILDAWSRRVPLGVPGELCVGGVQLARGYLGQPGLTADKFVPNPYGPSRLYRTGDLARWTSGGVEYLGRLDQQVKVRGMRVEPGEVEAALLALPEIRAAAVIARDNRLVAYLVADAEVDWAARLRERLPAQLVPDLFVSLDSLPLTANGKLDRSALPSPQPVVQVSGVLTDREKVVAAIWGDVLGVGALGPDDDFFAVGGDSIRSLKVISRLRAAGFTVSLADLFRARTVRDLAAHLTESGSREVAALGAFDLLSPEDRARLAGNGKEGAA